MSIDSKRFILGIFDDEVKMIHAMKELREERVEIYDVFTPFPVHGIDDYLEIRRTRLPIVCFIAATIGLIFSVLFQIWTSAFDWPLNIGGKSYNAFPAFVPVAFEITVLFGALASVGAFLFRAKLFPGQKVRLPYKTLTDDRFAVAIEEKDAGLDSEMIKQIFTQNNAEKILVSEGNEWSVN